MEEDGKIRNMDKLTEAFGAVAKIHKLIDEEKQGLDDPNYNYLTLEGLGQGLFAATFDTVGEFDWYEDDQITEYPHSAKTDNPATAILGAVAKLVEDLNLQLEIT